MAERTAERPPFWTSLPGLLTGAAALVGALATAWVALRPSSVPEAKRERMLIPAVEYANGPDVAAAMRTSAPRSFGNVLMNREPPDNNRRNWAEWKLPATARGAWLLRIEYAAGEPRPVQVQLNGNLVHQGALNAATGCWEDRCQQWRDVGRIVLAPGQDNVLRLDRPEGVFPHIRTLELQPVE